MNLRLTVWSTGEEPVLGFGHAHGAIFKML